LVRLLMLLLADSRPISLTWFVRIVWPCIVLRRHQRNRGHPPTKSLVVPVKKILGGVRHSRHLAWEVAGIGGGIAAHGVQPL
jgi:hypothetical protein